MMKFAHSRIPMAKIACHDHQRRAVHHCERRPSVAQAVKAGGRFGANCIDLPHGWPRAVWKMRSLPARPAHQPANSAAPSSVRRLGEDLLRDRLDGAALRLCTPGGEGGSIPMAGGFTVSSSACRTYRRVLICDAPSARGSSVRRWLRGRDGLSRRACRKDLIFFTCQPPAM
jgi:hypothetical protein